MRRVLACMTLVLAVSMSAAPLSLAADGGDASALPAAGNNDPSVLPTIINLGCVPRCAAITEPVPDKEYRASAEDLGVDLEDSFVRKPVDGLVELQYIVKADGHIGDIMVTHLVGLPQYADLAKGELKNGIYKPATMDGVAIDRDYRSVMKFYPVEALRDYSGVLLEEQRLVNDNKLDEADADLNEIKKHHLGFYERAAFANLESSVAMKRGDYAKARQLVDASVYFASVAGVRDSYRVSQLIWTRLLADLDVGDLQDAQAMLAYQKGIGDFHKNDPLVKEVDKLKTTIDGAAAFTVDAEIAPRGEGDAVVFGLYRRIFSVRKVTGGSLDKMIIRCQQQSVESDFSQRAEWHIPKNWDDCYVTIRGTAGTTFQIVQFAN